MPLTTNEQHLYKTINNIVVGEKDIFLLGSGKMIRYDRQGRFINAISRSGQGPTDLLYPDGVGIDDTAKIVYVSSGADNLIKAFTYEGHFIKSTRVAPDGTWVSGQMVNGKEVGYLFSHNHHIHRRGLPIKNPEFNWMLQVQDTAGCVLTSERDPINKNYEKEITQHSFDENKRPQTLELWAQNPPMMNDYHGTTLLLYEGNDTIYHYDWEDYSLKPIHILRCGSRPDVKTIRTFNKQPDFFKYLFVVDLLQTKDYLYLVAHKDASSHLMQINRTNGSIQSLSQKGEIKESQLMQVRYLTAYPPRFTNDLCGGPSIYPDYQDDRHWVSLFYPEELLSMDLEKLAQEKVLLPEKREQLIRTINHLKEDDNPILFIVTLK